MDFKTMIWIIRTFALSKLLKSPWNSDNRKSTVLCSAMPSMQYNAFGIASYLVKRNDTFPQAIYAVKDGYVKKQEVPIEEKNIVCVITEAVGVMFSHKRLSRNKGEVLQLCL